MSSRRLSRNSYRNHTPNKILVYTLCYKSLVCFRGLDTNKETNNSTFWFPVVEGPEISEFRKNEVPDTPEGNPGHFFSTIFELEGMSASSALFTGDRCTLFKGLRQELI